MTATESQIASNVPPDAFCLDCNYSLHGLPHNRCPECGREFDPANPWTMSVGRPHGAVVKFLLKPIGKPTVIAASIATLCVFWWTAALPQTSFAMAVGLALWTIVYLYRVARNIARRICSFVYRRRTEKKRRFIFLVLILLTASMIWTRWPLRAMFALHKPAFDRLAWHYYAEVPLVSPPPPPRRVGMYRLSAIRVHPNFVAIDLDSYLVGLIYSPNQQETTSPWWSPTAQDLSREWHFYSAAEFEMRPLAALVRWYYRVRYRFGF